MNHVPSDFSARNSRQFCGWLTLAFLGASGVIAWHHELWRDEMQAWLIARDSPNLRSLCLQGRYDGTPPLWYLLLRPLTLITHRPEAMQVLTWILAGLTFFLICRFAPFSRLQKVLLLPNYYLFYEYGTVCRQYLVGVLCLIIACILFPAGGKSPWAFTFALIAASLASVYSLILAVALAASFWGRAAADLRSADHRKSSGAPLLPSFLILGAGIALAVYCMLPEPDTYYAPADGWHFGSSMESLIRLGCAFTNAHFLFPRPDGYFWIPAWLTSLTLWQYLAAGLALPLFAGTVFLLRGSTRALLFYLVATIGILLFLHTKYLGFTRHVGFLFIAWLVALWLKKQSLAPERAPALAGGTTRGATVGLTVVLATQAVTGVCAAGLDYERAFSNGRAAAGELMSRHLEKACIAVWPDSSGADVAGYLDRSVYFPESGRWGSFTRWDRQHKEGMTDAEALRLAEQESGRAPLVLVLDHTLAPDLLRTHGLAALASCQGALVPFEDYFLYFRPTADSIPATP